MELFITSGNVLDSFGRCPSRMILLLLPVIYQSRSPNKSIQRYKELRQGDECSSVTLDSNDTYKSAILIGFLCRRVSVVLTSKF